jgi:hypothetical protein
MNQLWGKRKALLPKKFKSRFFKRVIKKGETKRIKNRRKRRNSKNQF